jgi:tetratricopeptide (TPR) repeat protein
VCFFQFCLGSAICGWSIALFAICELPPVTELIRETQAACAEFEKRHDHVSDSPLMELAEAQAYVGDYAGARQSAEKLSNIWRQISLSTLLEIRFEHDGVAPAVPRLKSGSAWEDICNALPSQTVIKCLIKAGRLDEARKRFCEDEGNRSSAYELAELTLLLADAQIRQADWFAAAESLRRAMEYVERVGVGMKSVEWLERMAPLWLKMDNRVQAAVVRDMAARLTRDWIMKSPASCYMALALARVGKIQAALGDKDAARETFRQALRLEDAANEKASQEPGPAFLHQRQHAKTVCEIGAWQHVAGLKGDAVRSFELASATTDTITDSSQRDGAFLDLVKLQTAAPDIDSAVASIVRMRDPYWQVNGYCQIAKSLAANGKGVEAKSFVEKAAEKMRLGSSPANTVSMHIELGETLALLGETAAAKKRYDAAMTLADEDGPRQWIARSQVRTGFLEDAYRTIQSISDPDLRLWPLAELSKRVAKGRKSP